MKDGLQKIEEKFEERIERLESEQRRNLAEEQRFKTAICGTNRQYESVSPGTVTYTNIWTEKHESDTAIANSLKNNGIYKAKHKGVYLVTASATAGTYDSSVINVYLRSSKPRYQDEILFMSHNSYSKERDQTAISATRYMLIREDETIWLEYQCSKNCVLLGLRIC